MGKMNLGFVKKNLAYFQFAAVVLTIAIGSHTALERFADWTASKVVVVHAVQMPVNTKNKNPRLQMVITVLRTDCGPVQQLNITLIDDLGIIHGVPNSLAGVYLSESQKSLKTRIRVPDLVSSGLVTGGGTVVHNCREGLVVSSLPEWKAIVLKNQRSGF